MKRVLSNQPVLGAISFGDSMKEIDIADIEKRLTRVETLMYLLLATNAPQLLMMMG